MQGVNVLGVSNPMQFPDDMDITDIRDFLRKKFTKQMVEGTQPVELGDRPQMMQAYEPTLQEKTANAIGEGLHSSGIISDRFGAQRIGENVSNIAAFTPAGAAFGGDEFGRATKKGDKLGMALGALEGVGIGGDIAKLAIFGGVLAKSADLKALAKAKKLETSGANRDEIWKETGWANDNGDWKFEISDYLDFDNEKGADINPSSFQIIKDFGGTTQENFMGHPELYDAYPNLRDRPIRSITGSGGQYNTGTDVVSIGDKLLSPTSGGELSNTQSVNLHELQHAIQQREKFAGGGSPDMFKGDKTIYDLKESQRKEFEDAYGYSQKFDYEILKKEPELYRELIKQGEQQGFSSRPFYDEFAKRNLPESDRVWFGKRMDSMDRELNSLRGNANKDPYEQYQRLAGEAEARNVQTRMDWTPEQRRATPPWKSLDVPEDELIYRKGGGIAQSTPSSAEMLGGVELGDAAKKSIKVYHGTPFKYDSPNLENYGSGEGGEGFGYGFHTSASPRTADNYATPSPLIEIDGMEYWGNQPENAIAKSILDDGYSKTLADVKGVIERKGETDFLARKVKMIESLKGASIVDKRSKGVVKEFLISDSDLNSFIDFDKGIDEQSDAVASALREAGLPTTGGDTGEDFYYEIAEGYGGGTDGDREASEFLDSIGVKGIKYKDSMEGQYMGDSGNYSNYTIFNPSNLNKPSTPSSAEMLGAVKLGDAAKGTNQYGDDVFNISITKEGKKAGDIQYIDDGKAITILRSDVEDAGKGTGTAAYEQLIYRALLEGKTIKSDAIVSPSAAKVYEKLKDKGYKVEKATELFNVRRGETTTNRESRMAQSASAPTMTDDYGNRISKPYRIKGEPVYTIKP